MSNHWLRDSAGALRLFAGRPGFSLLAIFSLALAFGAAIAIFSTADAVLVRALPYPDSGRLIDVRELDDKAQAMPLADLNFRDLSDTVHEFAAVAQYAGGTDLIVSGNNSRRGEIEAVSDNFFDVLGTAPLLGRAIDAKLDASDAHVAVIGHALWQEMLGGERDLSKLHLVVSGEHLQVIGVMPAAFNFPANTGVWFPRSLWPHETSRTAHNWHAIARLKPGADLAMARADAMALGVQLKAQFGRDVDASGFQLTPLRTALVGRVQNALLALVCGALFLLAIAAVNVINLFMALALARRKEFAVRAALGARRWRLAQQTILESVMLVAAAFALGLLFANVCLDGLIALAGDSLPRADEIGLDARVVVVLCVAAAGLAVMLGLLPLRGMVARSDALAEQGRATTLGHSGVRLRSALLVAQTALTVVLLIGAGLLGRSFLQLLEVDPGFRPHGAISVDVTLPRPADTVSARALAVRYSELMRRFAALPGVDAVGGVNALPLTDSGADGSFWDGAVVKELSDLAHPPAPMAYADFRVASADYFAAMAIPLQRGRSFDDRDNADASHVALVSASLARSVWPGRDAIGEQIQFGNMDGDMHVLTVVGVVGDVHDAGLDRGVRGTVYVNFAQRPVTASNFGIVVHGDLDAATLAAAVRAELVRSEPELPASLHTLESIYASSLDNRRFSLGLIGMFAVVALGLALSGVYGLMAYAVSERRAEFALRMALGASPAGVVRFVLGQGLRITLAGLVAGTAAALVAAAVAKSMLYGIPATDLPTFLGVGVLLLVASLGACALPAWRAARVDPRAHLV